VRAAATWNARSPTVERRVGGIISSFDKRVHVRWQMLDFVRTTCQYQYPRMTNNVSFLVIYNLQQIWTFNFSR